MMDSSNTGSDRDSIIATSARNTTYTRIQMTVENGDKTTDHLRVRIVRRPLGTAVVENSATLGYPALNSQPRLGRVFEERYARPDSRLNVGDATPGLKDFSIPFNPNLDDGVYGKTIHYFDEAAS